MLPDGELIIIRNFSSMCRLCVAVVSYNLGVKDSRVVPYSDRTTTTLTGRLRPSWGGGEEG